MLTILAAAILTIIIILTVLIVLTILIRSIPRARLHTQMRIWSYLELFRTIWSYLKLSEAT